MAKLGGDLKQWHKVTLEFDGPRVKEAASTFLDHRLDVTFRHEATGKTVTVPGHFAADGRAADSNAAEGSVWRAHFNPSEPGAWTWTASFRKGDGVAVAANAKAGASGGFMDGDTGRLTVGASGKGGDDLRGHGVLRHDGDEYLSFAGSGETFLKSGVGSPENFLAYSGFDNTPGSHAYGPHVRHFKGGDPSWDGGKGKGIIGAVNYLADQDVNSAYMILNTVGGDGRDVWPWAAGDLGGIRSNAAARKGSMNLGEDARAFDVSKLDQWEIVFEHMQKKGINLHLFFQETENDHLLNDGNLGVERMLLIREMVARFGHHNGIIWNLGEENTNSPAQLKAHSAFLQKLDPYGHAVALHTYPTQHNRYDAFKGSDALDVLSFQTNRPNEVPDLERFLANAEKAGRPVAAFLDEPGNPSVGIAARGDRGWEQNHDELRDVLWRSFMDGGSGVEWYFGYATGGGRAGDLKLEDFSTREPVYAWSAAARAFFEDLPLARMKGADQLTSGTKGTDEVLAEIGKTYAIFLPQGGSATLDLAGQSGRFDVTWYDPRTGASRDGSVDAVAGGGKVSIGQAPYDAGREWAVLVERTGGAPPKTEAPGLKPVTPTPEQPQKDDTVKNGFDGKGPGTHLMKNGRVVMQAEDGQFLNKGASGNANWEFKKGLAGYKGDGYLIWDTNKDYFNTRDAGKDHTGPMEYTFRVDGDAKDVAGTYHISLRAMKPVTGEKWDRNNDFYVAAGEADEAPSGWKKVFFSGDANKWLWGHTYDVNHKKSPATFTVDGPGEYSIFLSGRSRQAGIDEIHVQKGSKSLDHNAATSPVAGGASKPDPKPQPKPEPKPQPVDRDDDGPAAGGSQGGPVKAQRDALSFDGSDVVVKGGTASVTFKAADLLANDTGHAGRVWIKGEAARGEIEVSADGKTLTYSFDAAKGDITDAFNYHIASGKGAAGVGRVYLDVDTDGASSGGGGAKPAPKPQPQKPEPQKPEPKPQPEKPVKAEDSDLTLIDARTDKGILELGARTVIEAASVKGLDLDAMAEAPGGARSAKFTLDGKAQPVENLKPYALFADDRGDYEGGLALRAGATHRIEASFHGGPNATGKVVGETAAQISVQDGTIRGSSGADVFAFDEGKMGRDTVVNFQEGDALAFMGGLSARQALSKAKAVDGDTVFDFGGGDVLVLRDFTGVGLDDILA